MSARKNTIKIRLAATLIFLALSGIFIVLINLDGTVVTNSVKAKSMSDKAKFNKKGELIRPEGYREWIYVGTPVTPNDLNGGNAPFPEFHNVYIHPADYKYYKKNGKWQDGTILVKELVSVGSKSASSGKGYFMGEFIGLEATVKDKKRFPEEPGNWAYFSFTTKDHSSLNATAKAFPTNSCNSCHQANAGSDFVFTQFYPVLRDANPNKTKSKDTKFETSSPTGRTSVNSDVPTEKDELFEFLKSGKYKGFAKEEAIHPSRGPHENVLTFFNMALEKSMKSGNTEHPVGAASVKEMYKDGNPFGWAVMVKTEMGKGGNGWYWYEVTSTTDSSKIFAEGNGARSCVGCHAPGKDYVLTDFK